MNENNVTDSYIGYGSSTEVTVTYWNGQAFLVVPFLSSTEPVIYTVPSVIYKDKTDV